MTIKTSTNEQAKRIIIEGPDCVGKDTFIARLQSFIQGNPEHGGRNVITLDKYYWRNRRTLEIHKDDTASILDYQMRFPNEFTRTHEALTIPYTVPRYADMVSYQAIHSKDGSQESAAFIQALDKGEITDQRTIAEEYLQIHYDLECLAKSLDETLSMVVMNRSLISYHAMQIHALGFTDLEEKWQKLWNFSRQDEALFVRLTAPESVVRERLAKRQGDDFRGEVENFYMSKWNAIEQGFIQFQAKKLCAETITVDTSTSNDEIDAKIQSILEWVVHNEIYESVMRNA